MLLALAWIGLGRLEDYIAVMNGEWIWAQDCHISSGRTRGSDEPLTNKLNPYPHCNL